MTQSAVCIVTGGSSGIGRALSVALARRGYRVVVVGRDRARIDAALAEIAPASSQGTKLEHLGLALDVGDPRDMQRMAEQCLDRYGRIDVLIASAGIGRTSAAESKLPSPTAELTVSEWDGVLNVNLHGVFLSNQAVLPAMIAQRSGDIVNICSTTTPKGLRGRPFAQAYSASKFAVAAFTEVLAREVEEIGVRVHAIFPGPVETPLIENTRLDAPFGGRVAAPNFAKSVLGILDLSLEMNLVSPHILPMHHRSNLSTG